MINKKYKTILRLAPFPTVEESGRGLHPYELSKLKNIKVIYLTFFEKNATPFNIPKNVKLIKGSFYTNPFPRNSNFLTKFFFQIYRFFKILIFSLHGIFLAIKYNVDIIHIHSAMFSLVSVVTKLMGKKNIISFHGADYFRIEKAIWYKFFAGYFDLVLSISPRYIERLKQIHSCDVFQIYNGIDPQVYVNRNLLRKKQILAVVNFKPQKGIEYLISGYKLLIDKYPDYKMYKLVLVGKGILFNDIKLMIKNLNLQGSVKLLGQKKRSELIKIYNESEIFVLSSIWEGFAKVLIEAMSCGCKVISTEVDSAPLLLNDWGYMISHSDATAISESLKKLIDDKNYNFDKQKKSVNNFSWDYVRDIYEKQLLNL